jgi:hypothetical protein
MNPILPALALLLLCSCAPLPVSASVIVTESPKMAYSQNAIATSTAEPTPDYQAQIDAARADAEQARNAANVAIDAQQEAERVALAAQAQAQAAEVEKLKEINRGAEIKLTEQTNDQIRQNGIFTENARADQAAIDRTQAETARLQAEAAKNRTDTEAKKVTVNNIAAILMSLSALIIALSLAGYMIVGKRPPEVVGEDPQPETKERVWKQDGASLIDITPPGSPEAFLKFALTVRTNPVLTLAKDKWEGADSPYNRQTYAPVFGWMARHNFMGWVSGALHLTPAGEKFFDDYLERNYRPTFDADIVKSDTPSLQNPENQAAESGGGQVETKGITE